MEYTKTPNELKINLF